MWAGEDNLEDPKINPSCADLAGYLDTLVLQGTNEIIYPDNLNLYQNMKDAGVNVTFVAAEGH